MKLSIIIPTYNHLHDFLNPCLDSLTQHCDLSDTEVIVVANGCVDKTEESVTRRGFQVVSINHPIGYYRAFEAGLEKASGEYVLSLHNDVTFLEQSKNHVIDSLMAEIYTNTVSLIGVGQKYDPNTRRFYVPLYCAMFRRFALNSIGVGKERYTSSLDYAGSGEEVAISARINDRHFSIGQVGGNELLEGAIMPVHHGGGMTSAKMHNYEYRQARNAAVLREKLRKKITTSIVITATNVEQLRQCVRSVWKHTDLAGVEVKIIHDQQNAEIDAYIKRLLTCGPYSSVVHPTHNLEKAINFALPFCTGEYVVSLSQPVSYGWLDDMLKPILTDDSTVLFSRDLTQTAFVKDAISYLGGFSDELWSGIRRRGLRIHEKSSS